jgi:Mg2+/citrate symporter
MEIFKYILPAFIVMMTAYLLFDRMLNNEEKKRKHELAKKNQEVTVPIRLRAYERIMLLLERTKPGTMVLDVIKPGMKCIDFQTLLIQNIRKEFEHNYAQQIYVSNELWEAVSTTRENLIKLVNTAAAHFNPEDNASKMAESIIRIYAETEQTPTSIAIDILKTEISNQYYI